MGTDRPLFSVLIPSRNRLELLRHAVDSVLGQDASFEIIIADNASNEPYSDYISSLGQIASRSVRSEIPLPVTENWNRALAAATGRYFIMLGDDDALCPGWLTRATGLIEKFEEPDVLYAMAYHYAYPGVIQSRSGGYFASVNNSDVFRVFEQPYLLARSDAVFLGEQALRFRHRFSFNSQHFTWSRQFVELVAQAGPFFQGPYPDYYAAMVTMLSANKICVVTKPQVTIGISPKSFGFYYNNAQFDAGQDMLRNTSDKHLPTAVLSSDVKSAIEFPGSGHYRNWLISTLLVVGNLGLARDRQIDFRRYRQLQLLELFFGDEKHRIGKNERDMLLKQHLPVADLARCRKLELLEMLLDDEKPRLPTVKRLTHLKALKPDEATRRGDLRWLERVISRQPANQITNEQLLKMSRIYTPAVVTEHDIGPHSSIADAFRWLETQITSPDAIETIHPLVNINTGTTIAVVYLARCSHGSALEFAPFVNSYRAHEAGIPHDLIVLRKGMQGFPTAQRELVSMMDGIPHRTVDISDEGFDIQAYLKIARSLKHDRICFLNTHSEINAGNWLQKLNEPLNQDEVGISGATGSYESLYTSLYLLSKAIWLAANEGIQYSPKIARQFRQILLVNAPAWMSRRGSILRQIMRELARPILGRPFDTPEREKKFEKHWRALTQFGGPFHAFRDFKRFPNPHLRSNAFMIRRELLIDLSFELDNTKQSCNRFESGPDGLHMRIAQRGLSSVLVGADGSIYDVAQWPQSQTFRLGSQKNVLVIDNQVRNFAKMSKGEKILHERITWGNFLPRTASEFVDLGVKFDRGSLDVREHASLLAEIGHLPRCATGDNGVAIGNVFQTAGCFDQTERTASR